jgi:hypothetical protein
MALEFGRQPEHPIWIDLPISSAKSSGNPRHKRCCRRSETFGDRDGRIDLQRERKLLAYRPFRRSENTVAASRAERADVVDIPFVSRFRCDKTPQLDCKSDRVKGRTEIGRGRGSRS